MTKSQMHDSLVAIAKVLHGSDYDDMLNTEKRIARVLCTANIGAWDDIVNDEYYAGRCLIFTVK
jgi:hypothetical protein